MIQSEDTEKSEKEEAIIEAELLYKLKSAINRGEVEKTIELIETNNIDPNSIVDVTFGETVLVKVINEGQKEILKYLFDKNLEDNKLNIYAKDNSSSNILHIILSNIRFKIRKESDTPEIEAEIENDFAILEMILDHEMKLREKYPALEKQHPLRDMLDKYKEPPIQALSMLKEKQKRASKLISAYDTKEKYCKSLSTMIFYTSYYGRHVMHRMLLDHITLDTLGDLYIQDELGDTQLHKAYRGYVQNLDNIHIKSNHQEIFNNIVRKEKELRGLNPDTKILPLRLIENKDGKRAVETIDPSYVVVNNPYDTAVGNIAEEEKKAKGEAARKFNPMWTVDVKDKPIGYFIEKQEKLYDQDIKGDSILHLICYFIENQYKEGNKEGFKLGLSLAKSAFKYEIIVKTKLGLEGENLLNLIDQPNELGKTPIDIISNNKFKDKLKRRRDLAEQEYNEETYRKNQEELKLTEEERKTTDYQEFVLSRSNVGIHKRPISKTKDEDKVKADPLDTKKETNFVQKEIEKSLKENSEGSGCIIS